MTARVSLPAPVAAAPGIPTDAAGATEAPPAAKVEALPLSLAIAAVVLVVRTESARCVCVTLTRVSCFAICCPASTGSTSAASTIGSPTGPRAPCAE
ncbi:unnamed protein product [Closterium sp. NIES-64]|nr:unnamed protein product [Closterium sp. NIES-64]